MREKPPNKVTAEIICFILFILGTLFISIFHEPWHDEFQAWGISKDTLYNIFFVIPHYEGHPPLWHLILKCFSYSGVHPEIGLRIPNLLFMYGAVFLLIFKSPFPKVLRLILPFTYFIFYQYSIVSRPYSIFCFAIFLAAYFYKERNEHPYRYISALCLLCLSCAYGMVFAAGITAVWFIEIIRDYIKSSITHTLGGGQGGGAASSFRPGSRIKALMLFIFCCAVITALIFIDKNAYNEIGGINSAKLLYALFGLPCDALISNIEYNLPALKHFPLIYCILGSIIYTALFILFRYFKAAMLFFIPYFMFIAVCGLLYVCGHHTGLLTLFIIYALWCALSVNEKIMPGKYKKITAAAVLIPLCIQLYWSACAYINEYKYDYWFSRALSRYIKDNNLDKYSIMSGWEVNPEPKIINGKKVFEYNFIQQNVPVSIIPYLKKNVFYNFNSFYPDKEYTILKSMSLDDREKIIKEWRKYGLPDIIFGYPSILSLVFEYDELKNQFYDRLYIFVFHKPWKNKTINADIPIYAKSSVYEQIINNMQEKNNE